MSDERVCCGTCGGYIIHNSVCMNCRDAIVDAQETNRAKFERRMRDLLATELRETGNFAEALIAEIMSAADTFVDKERAVAKREEMLRIYNKDPFNCDNCQILYCGYHG